MAKPATKNSATGTSRWSEFLDEKTTHDEERRQSARVPTYIFAKLVVEANVEVDCIIRDMSDGGARIKLEEERDLPGTVKLTFIETGQTRVCRTVWQKSKHAGLEFWNTKRKTYKAARDDDDE